MYVVTKSCGYKGKWLQSHVVTKSRDEKATFSMTKLTRVPTATCPSMTVL